MQEEQEHLKEVVESFETLIEENFLMQKMVKKNYSSDVDTMIEKLNKLENKEKALKKNIEKPYFARIDFKADDYDKKDICYIGKIGTMDADNRIITVDWRAPIASLYYDSNVGKCSYISPEGQISGELLIKRQYDIENRKLNSFQDVDAVTSDELLNAQLNTSMDSRLKNIVSTIQKEQNDIIRKPIEHDIIVQGVAGSGKTTVALHRIAYLVYQNRKNIDIDQYMVIGPNRFFVNYISNVLPDLDVNGIMEYDLLGFANAYLNEDIKLKKSFDTDETKYKMDIKYKDEIDSYVEKLNRMVVPNKNLEMYGFIILSSQEILKIYKEVEKETEYISDRVERAIMFIENKISDNMDNIIVKGNNYIDELFKKETNEKELKKISQMREKLKQEIKSKCSHILKNYFYIVNEKTTSLYSKFLVSKNQSKDIKYEDLPGLLYLRYRIIGNRDYIKYRHVVIDESQDYGSFIFYVMKQIMKKSTFSVFGDLAQTIYKYRTIDNWQNVVDMGYEDNIQYLTKSYRTTIEIMEQANKINKHLGLTVADAVIRHGPKVSFEKNISILEKIKELKKKEYNTIAVISKNSEDSKRIYDELKNEIDINLVDETTQDYTGGIVSITSTLSKGLEFDAVIIDNVDDDVFDINEPLDMKLLYVSMTRALHELVINYNKNLVEIL